MIAKTANYKAKDTLAICERLYAIPDLLNDKIAKKYFDQFRVTIPISRGITYPTDCTLSSILSYKRPIGARHSSGFSLSGPDGSNLAREPLLSTSSSGLMMS